MSVRGWLRNAVDGLFDIVSPQRSYQRQAYRVAGELVDDYRHSVAISNRVGSAGGSGGFEGAKANRSRSEWLPTAGSADSDVLPDLQMLRQRSRNLLMNDGNAVAIVDSIVSNVVATGITPEPKLDRERLGLDDDQAREAQGDMMRAWNRWSRYADATGRLDMAELQAQMVWGWIVNGEVFARITKSDVPGNPYSFGLEVIESDRVDTPEGLNYQQRNVRAGVELNVAGRPVAYWVAKQHPGDEAMGIQSRQRGKRRFRRVEAFDGRGRASMLHLFTQKRPGQSRGFPWLAPVLNEFKDFGDFKKAEVMAAKVSACVALLIERDGNGPGGPMPLTVSKNSDGTNSTKLYPGAVLDPGAGKKLTTFNPARPNSTFEPFTMAMIRLIAGAMGVPYEVALRDFSKTTYSSARASILEARRMFRSLMGALSRRIMQRLWIEVQEEAWLRGELRHVTNFRKDIDEWTRCRWNGAGWEWIDPQKEAAGQKVAHELGVVTLEEIIRSRSGASFEEVCEQRAYEQQVLEELGLKGKAPTFGDDPEGGDDAPPPGEEGEDDNEPRTPEDEREQEEPTEESEEEQAA